MSEALKTGLKTTRAFTVDEERTIDFLKPGTGHRVGAQSAVGDARVYATPSLIMDIETTCRDFLLGYLRSGQDSLGTAVDIKHLAPTLMGMKVDIKIEIARLDGNAVSFDVIVSDPVDDVVASGRHERFIVEVDKVIQRLAAKRPRRLN